MRAFLLIFAAGLGCAALGSGIGWLIGWLSPEFVALLVQPFPVAEPQRMGAVLGLLSGLLLGVCAMAFGLLVEAFRVWATSGRTVQELPPTEALPQNGPFGGGTSRTAVQRPGR